MLFDEFQYTLKFSFIKKKAQALIENPIFIKKKKSLSKRFCIQHFLLYFKVDYAMHFFVLLVNKYYWLACC